MSESSLGFLRVKVIPLPVTNLVQLHDEFHAGGFHDGEGNNLWFCSPV